MTEGLLCLQKLLMSELSRLRSPRSGLGLGSQSQLTGSGVGGTRAILSGSQTPLTPHSRMTRHHLLGSPRPRPQYLQLTEERIFGEVVGLVDEIEGLRAGIREQAGAVERMQRERPDIAGRVRFHSFSDRLTSQQCLDLEEENVELERQIHGLRSQKVGTLNEVLRLEREQYEELRAEVAESGSPRSVGQRIEQLRESVARLEQQRAQTVESHFPDFNSLREGNERLRQKTAALLQGRGEEWEMREYLREEEASREQFLASLQESKQLFARLTRENDDLRRRLQAQGKENTSPRTLPIHSPKQSPSARGRVDRLSEYESFLSMVQQSQL